MPTPVATARQCLTEEAARALDDAVSVARRRSHAQTTSLHAVSALLSPGGSLLRESLSRARSSAYSPRLQFRALELCVGVSLDRLPCSKPSSSQDDDFAPPVSNSLMAAIKRSQANQRRQPDIYHLNFLNCHNLNINNTTNTNTNSNNNNNNPISINTVKVELKHFVLSILDDPIVSRVLGEAGFRSSEIKMAILHPPAGRWGGPPASARCPPLFLCNLVDPLPPGGPAGGLDEGSRRRIGEVMGKERERNPVLVGVCAAGALSGLKDCLARGSPDGGLPRATLVCLEREVEGFLRRREREALEAKAAEAERALSEGGGGEGGVVINLGELKLLCGEDGNGGGAEAELVSMVSRLLEGCSSNRNSGDHGDKEEEEKGRRKKVWLIGAAASYETYAKFVGRFPGVEREWDLHPLPITSSSSSPWSSSSSFDAIASKSSLMGSFVPFGGFFPATSDFRPPLTLVKQPYTKPPTRCNACKVKYEQELCALLREGSAVSVAGTCSASLPSWLRQNTKEGDALAQGRDVKVASKETILGLQKKWDDHCQRLHQIFPAPGVGLGRPQAPHSLALPVVVSDKQGSRTSSDNSSLNEGACSNSSSGMQVVAQNVGPQQKVVTVDFPRKPSEISGCHPSVREISVPMVFPISNLGQSSDHKPASSVSVTTDLGLGTIYASKREGLKKPDQMCLQRFPGSIPSNCGIVEKAPLQSFQSSLPGSRERLEPSEYKALLRKLSEAVEWQGEAICGISETVSGCRSGCGRQRPSNMRGNIWLVFHGPDKIGKRKVAGALADAMFGSKDHLIVVDLSTQDSCSRTDSLFLCQGSRDFDINVSRTTVVDHIALELCKKPHSVVFLENIDEADPMVQNSLTRAIQTGRFQDSHGREISIKNVVFIATSCAIKGEKSLSPRREFIKFSEEKILRAKNWQMQMAIRSVSGDEARSHETKVSLVSAKSGSDQGTSKRKVFETGDSSDQLEVPKRAKKASKNSLDLNLPLEEVEESVETYSSKSDPPFDGSAAWLEDFFGQADGNVVFKPFDFDALADKLLRRIRLKFEEASRGENTLLEIDDEVMVQVLAAAWCSDKKDAVEDWIEEVLVGSFSDMRERNRLTGESVVRLVSCDGVPVKEWASSICLPRSISLGV